MYLWTDFKALLSMLAFALIVLSFGVLCLWCVQMQQTEAERACAEKLDGVWSCPERPDECACYRWGKVVTGKEAK